MFNLHTPFYGIHSSMTCTCLQCQHERNAQTAQLENLTRIDGRWKVTQSINSETGERRTYYWPLHIRATVQGNTAWEVIHTIHSETCEQSTYYQPVQQIRTSVPAR